MARGRVGGTRCVCYLDYDQQEWKSQQKCIVSPDFCGPVPPCLSDFCAITPAPDEQNVHSSWFPLVFVLLFVRDAAL